MSFNDETISDNVTLYVCRRWAQMSMIYKTCAGVCIVLSTFSSSSAELMSRILFCICQKIFQNVAVSIHFYISLNFASNIFNSYLFLPFHCGVVSILFLIFFLIYTKYLASDKIPEFILWKHVSHTHLHTHTRCLPINSGIWTASMNSLFSVHLVACIENCLMYPERAMHLMHTQIDVHSFLCIRVYV